MLAMAPENMVGSSPAFYPKGVHMRRAAALVVALFVTSPAFAAEPNWWSEEVEAALKRSKDNCKELEKALTQDDTINFGGRVGKRVVRPRPVTGDHLRRL